MKKIGIYDPYLDDTGGGEKYMLTIAQVLQKESKVSVFWNNPEDLERAKERFSLKIPDVSLAHNIFTNKTSTFSRLSKTRAYDSVIVLSDGSIPLVFCKLFIHIQRPLEHVRLTPLMKIKMKRVRAFFCNSEYTKSYIDRTYNISAEVLYPPVKLYPQDVKKKKIILHVGRFRVYDKTVDTGDYKKQHIMVDTFKEMVDKGLKGWMFVLCVSVLDKDKEDFERLKEKAKGYPIEFQVNKNNKKLWDYYSEASIYWHASGYGENLESHPELAEHFGISTVEAMGAGAVPVVINAGGQKEIVKNGENGYTWDTLEELKEKTLKLIGSAKLLEELSQKAKERSKDFSIEAFEAKLLKIINS